MSDPDRLYSIEECAAVLRVGRHTIMRLIARGELPAIKGSIGRTLIRRCDIQDWQRRYLVRISPHQSAKQ